MFLKVGQKLCQDLNLDGFLLQRGFDNKVGLAQRRQVFRQRQPFHGGVTIRDVQLFFFNLTLQLGRDKIPRCVQSAFVHIVKLDVIS